MDKVEKKIASDVAKFGWHVIMAFSDTTRGPPFAYTIGLETTFQHPEIILFGLNNDLEFMHHVLNEIGERVRKGETFSHGARKKNILPGYVCVFARVPKTAYSEHLGRAIDFHRGTRFRAVQCIWPDPKKRLPWDERVMLPILSREPVLLRPTAGPRDPTWPFDEPHSRFVITSRQVATGREPVRYVGRFRDGDWQFVCSTTSDPKDMVLATLGWIADRDPSVRAAARLRPGTSIERRAPGAKWRAGARED